MFQYSIARLNAFNNINDNNNHHNKKKNNNNNNNSKSDNNNNSNNNCNNTDRSLLQMQSKGISQLESEHNYNRRRLRNSP